MGVCIVTPNVIQGDGQGQVNYEIAREVLRRGYSLHLVTKKIAPDLLANSQVTWVPIKVKGIPTELIRHIISIQQVDRWLRINRDQFDLLIVNGDMTSQPSDINIVHFVHSAWLRSPSHVSRKQKNFYGMYQWAYTFFNSKWEKTAFQKAKAIVAVSNQVKQELIKIHIPSNKIHTYLNGVNLDEFHPGEGDRQNLNLPDQVPLALFVGDIRSGRKNLDAILHALKSVHHLHLLVVGRLEGSPYPKMVQNLGLCERVHFLGFRNNVAEIMRLADFFVFPSHYEACTLALLEAMASGLPVVTASTTGGSEVVTPDCGIVLEDSRDIHSLSNALSLLANNHVKRISMGKVARSVAEQYSWLRTAESYLDLFEYMARQ